MKAHQYRDAPDVREIASDLIAEHHPHLALPGIRIFYAFTDESPKSKGDEVWARIKPMSGREAFLAQRDAPPGSRFTEGFTGFAVNKIHCFNVAELLGVTKKILDDHSGFLWTVIEACQACGITSPRYGGRMKLSVNKMMKLNDRMAETRRGLPEKKKEKEATYATAP